MKIREYLNGILGGFLGCLFCLVVFGTTFTYTYDKTTPAGTDSPTVLDDRDRETKLAIQERENVDHYWPYASFADVAGGNEVASAYTGEHRKITFYANITDPTQVTGKSHLYQKGGELYFQDATNTTLKLTSGGALNSSAGLAVTGNATVGGTLDVTGNIDPTSYETTNGGFKDEDAMTSNSATAVASQQSIKKYVDDQDTADHPAYSGGESHTDGSGLIIKMGHSTSPSGDSASGNVTITFGTAFPNAVVSVVATMRNNTSTGTFMFYFTDNPSTTGFVFRYKEYSGTHSLDGFDWIAIGY